MRQFINIAAVIREITNKNNQKKNTFFLLSLIKLYKYKYFHIKMLPSKKIHRENKMRKRQQQRSKFYVLWFFFGIWKKLSENIYYKSGDCKMDNPLAT